MAVTGSPLAREKMSLLRPKQSPIEKKTPNFSLKNVTKGSFLLFIMLLGAGQNTQAMKATTAPAPLVCKQSQILAQEKDACLSVGEYKKTKNAFAF